MGIVEKDEAAAQKILPQARGFGIAQVPSSRLRGVDPRVFEDTVVGEPEVARIAAIDARQPLDSHGEMIVGCRPIDQPPARSPAVPR